MADATMDVDVLQGRLQAWAAWLTGGGSGVGYPTKSVLHSSWLPPTAGLTPTMVAGTGDGGRRERALHHVISTALSVRLQNTLVVVYVMRASVATFRNHSKVMLLANPGQHRYLVVESSANINTNPRTEQTAVTADAGLFHHYLDFFNEVKSFNANFDAWVPYGR